MSLIQCPECQKEISNTAKACPHCGYLIDEVETTTNQIQRTKLGKKHRNISAGVLIVVFGIFTMLISILFFPLGIIAFIGGIAILVLGASKITWMQKAICPYCGFEAEITVTSTSHKCTNCKKTSVRKGNFLETVKR